MKNTFLACALIAGLVLSVAQAASIKSIKGFSSPESVFVGKDFIFVSNIGVKPEVLAKDGDGFISKLDKNGKMIEQKFASLLNAPKGMFELNGNLYVLDIDTLVGFNVKNGKKVFELEIKGSVFLNGIVALDSTTLLISDTSTGSIYSLDLQSKTYKEFVRLDLAKFGGGNGMLLDPKKDTLYVACYHPDGKSGGVVLSIDIKSKKITTIYDKKGAYDGIVFAKNGDLLVSDWGEGLNGKILRLNKNTKGATALELLAMKGPADMFSDGNTLYVPKMLENEVVILPLP
ncbi:ATP-binding protein [Campylobacter troglodytis]|uniref:ATP-binding protein n=1 Tax=Campylobacter troglodytis TaxID=654363 RepID=UPI001157E819|nr:ATP-binding protein [Campylobacter troglodytis]TQR60874.1 ATP-binding protein [Campylobacter troglodytis]